MIPGRRRLAVPALAILLAAVGNDSALTHYRLDSAPAWRSQLAAPLREISGIAFTSDGRLLAHGDENATIWELSSDGRRIVKVFGPGRGGAAMRGDFEDIAIVGNRIFLVISDGSVIETREGPANAITPATRISPALHGTCEVEGLTPDAGNRALLLLCKSARTKAWRGKVVVLALSLETGRLEPRPRMVIDEKDLERVTGVKRFNGSAITRHPRTGTYLLVAGPQRTYAEVTATGEVLGGGRLDHGLHRQAEGIAVAPDLTLLVSDEGGTGLATLTGYAFHP